jgi:hypothetical protein
VWKLPSNLLARQLKGEKLGGFQSGDVNVFCVVLDFLGLLFVCEKAVQIGFACEQRKEEKTVMVCSHLIVTSSVAHLHLQNLHKVPLHHWF